MAAFIFFDIALSSETGRKAEPYAWFTEADRSKWRRARKDEPSLRTVQLL